MSSLSPVSLTRSFKTLTRYSLAVLFGSAIAQAETSVAVAKSLPTGASETAEVDTDLGLKNDSFTDLQPIDQPSDDRSLAHESLNDEFSDRQFSNRDFNKFSNEFNNDKLNSVVEELEEPEELLLEPGSDRDQDEVFQEVRQSEPDSEPELSFALKPFAPEPRSSERLAVEAFPQTALPTPLSALEGHESDRESAVELPEMARISQDSDQAIHQLFVGESESLVARAVGSAEGTRTPGGDKTWAYYGHTDPGNGAFNLGTFSYQHGANSPQEADQKQLTRLLEQAQQLQQAAETKNIQMSLEERLNGIDLANQSPRAALSRGGYLDRLHEAYTMGLRGEDAILWARVHSYKDPDTERWNAPGLGNNGSQIEADQRRRMEAIADAIAVTPSSSPEDSLFDRLPDQAAISPFAEPPRSQTLTADNDFSLKL